MHSGSGKASGASKGSKGGKHLHKDKTRSKRKTTHAEVRSSSRASSNRGDQDPRSAGHRASHSPTVNDTRDWLNSSTALGEYQEDSSIEYNKHRQSLDLLGLALQVSKDDLLESEIKSPGDVVEPITQENTSACPVHSALLVGLQGATSSRSGAGQETDTTSMERYLAEGLAERYALLKVSQTETGGEWARYSACLCRRK